MGPIALFLLVVSAFLFPPPVLASEVSESEFPRCPYDDMEKARATYGREIANLSSAGGRASRTGLRLTLRSRDRAVVLEDDCSSTESAVRHFFESHLPRRDHHRDLRPIFRFGHRCGALIDHALPNEAGDLVRAGSPEGSDEPAE